MYYSKDFVSRDATCHGREIGNYLDEYPERIVVSITAYPHPEKYITIIITKDKEKRDENESSGIQT